MSPKSTPVLIVGAGVFGLSLAHELAANRGYTSVTILDRFLPPVPDGSSVDVSRIIRTEYADPLYSSLAADALQGWRTSEVYRPHYHESGFVMMADERERPSPYFEKYRQWKTAQDRERPLEFFEPPHADDEVKRLYRGVQADLREFAATHNRAGGWADAAGAIRTLAGRCTLAGVSFVTGAQGTVVSLLRRQGAGGEERVTGVRTAAGTTLEAERVVLATGAWTNRVVPGVSHAVAASAQPVGFIRLSDDEAERVRDMPVMVNMSTGVFCFPPTPETNLLKVARHGFGYATEFEAEAPTVASHGHDGEGNGNGEATGGGMRRKVSSPKLVGSNAASGFLPRDADEGLRDGVRLFFPEFAEREWVYRRLCWYTDTPEGDFVVDYHPDLEGLFFATGGAGHAFKFLPVIGTHVADCFERKASTALRDKWRLRKAVGGETTLRMAGDGSRAGPALRKLSPQEQAKL
ncbi:Putative FAD dependent oxidoreductase, FAD/NAD(P)-binding domain superfamily, MTOX family [Colletotrichum destructivum]|uniref:FAD dependent oxidoreductase, FAD/NAD(P)-binding domain superfamily, MTOX family n=1 Tax=Colletotrichum destructivum TaxID=34406 RepID=A0AAX4IZL5_9PEZI|nr:Putative FAD dependent oxidoreductase, FAD/NAD(P)-binding domain superfamily, MTOX family [Colletotrichum destructivum]